MWWLFSIQVALFGIASSLKLGSSVPAVEVNETRQRRSAFLSCEAAAQSCSTHFGDLTSYPNIAAGFRGFNVVLGGVEVPCNPAGKRGFIFDEAQERSSSVRFNNIAGQEHANCRGDLEVRVIRTVEEMFDAKTSTKLDSSSSQVGQQLNINAKFGADGSLSIDLMNSLKKLFGSSKSSGSTEEDHTESHRNLHGELSGGGSIGYEALITSGEAHGDLLIGGDIGDSSSSTHTRSVALKDTELNSASEVAKSGTSFSAGASVGVGFKIPPIWKSLASNNEREQKIATSIDSKQVTTTKASTHCKRYSYQLQRYSPPAFHSAFKIGLAQLNQCWNAPADANPNSYQCARDFINAYGTHFVKRATFGAKVTTTRVFDFEKANKQSRQTLDHCTRSQPTWSVLGIFTKGDTISDCQNELSTGFSISRSGLQKEETESVGCKPSVDYGDEGPFPPEIIEKTLAPISDLFTSEFMNEERVGTSIDFESIRPWLADKIVDYCVLFKSQYHCKHTTRLEYSCAHCPGVNPNHCAGVYTGSIDIDFLPHTPGDQGVLNIPAGQIVSEWKHGCPVGQIHTNRLDISSCNCLLADPNRCAGHYKGGLDKNFLPHTPGHQGVLDFTSDQLKPIVNEWEHGCPAPVKILVRKEVGNPADYFDKTYAEYQAGFSANGESWLGLDNLHRLTNQQDYKLKIIMTDFDGKKYVAVYDHFKVGPPANYVLTVGGFNDALSTLGDGMTRDNNGMKFSTKDRDQDRSPGNCAQMYTGGWWYNHCTSAHLTGMHTETRSQIGSKQIFYYYGGERGTGYDSWAEAEMLLLAN